MGKINFYLLRFRKASLPEIIYRANQFILIKKLKIQISKKKDPVVVPTIDYNDFKSLQLPTIYGKTSEGLVQKILDGKIFSLNTDAGAIKQFENTWRNTYFSDIKIPDQNPDIRAVLEPARLQHLVVLIHHILQKKETHDVEAIKQFIKNSLINWIQKNPFLFGPHYISALECGLRIPALFYFLKFYSNSDMDEYQLILNTIFQHGWWISKRLSLYSSLGNHTVAECVGLIFAGAIFRNTKEGLIWLKSGCNLLRLQLNDQILKDGGPVERSFSYHRFVLNLYWLAIDFLEKNSFYDCSDFKEHLNKAEHFLMAFEDPFGRLPPIGDSDGGHAIAPGLYSRRIPLDCNSLKIKNFFITGYSIIKDNDAVLTFDHGPLGMAPLYNHGHSDALSITLSVNNKEIIVDPGTYRYHGRPEFRKYFKSTRAHNTITIDGMDQAVQETGFIWSRPYTSELIKSEKIDGGYFIQACHNGYLRLKEPLVHWRSIVYLGKRKFIIKDSFSGNGVHLFEINYHLHPNAEVTQEDSGWWKINNQGAEIYIGFLDKKKLFTFAKGQKDPLLGWYSTSYGIKCESGVLSYAEKGNIKEVSFLTAIDTEAPLNLESIRGRIFQIEKQIEHF